MQRNFNTYAQNPQNPQNRQNQQGVSQNARAQGGFFDDDEPFGNNKFLTIQNARADIIGELDAIIQYENHLLSTNDASAKKTIIDIVNEEKVHVGQLFGLLFKLDPMSQTQFEKGYNEFCDNDERNY